jgi:hypothetical protein
MAKSTPKAEWQIEHYIREEIASGAVLPPSSMKARAPGPMQAGVRNEKDKVNRRL